MNRYVALLMLALGGILGFGLAELWPPEARQQDFFTQDWSTPASRDGRSLAEDEDLAQPRLSFAEAISARETQYADIHSVRDVLALPTDFAQTEALYVLAGRADANQLQRHIQEAQALATGADRRAALQILFSRYAELDPVAALLFIDRSQLSGKDGLIGTVFYSWSKVALQQAIHAANLIKNPEHQRQAAEAILRAQSELRPDRVAEIAARLDLREGREQFEIQALLALAERDPGAALARLTELEPQLRTQAAYAVGQALAQDNPGAALTQIQAFAGERFYPELHQAILNQWVQQEPEAGFRYLQTLEQSAYNSQLANQALAYLALTNPDHALVLADELDGMSQRTARHAIFNTWAQQDVRAAAAALERQADTRLRQELLGTLAYQYASQYPDEALEWARNQQGALRQQSLQTVLGNIAQHEPERAWAILSAEPELDNGNLLNSILSSLALSDPRQAAAYVAELPVGGRRAQAVASIAQQWAQREPRAAFDWVSSLDAQDYATAIRTLAFGISQNDPDLAASLTASVHQDYRGEWVGTLTQYYAQRSPDAALAWIDQFRGETYFPQALGQIARFMALTDPPRAIRLLEESGTQELAAASVPSLIYQWATTDPQAALQYAESLAAGRTRQQAVRNALNHWAQYDEAQARQWALSRPQGEVRDIALASVARQSRASTAEVANLVEQIQSVSIRNSAIAERFMVLATADTDAARAFLDRMPLDEPTRANLLRTLEQQRAGISSGAFSTGGPGSVPRVFFNADGVVQPSLVPLSEQR